MYRTSVRASKELFAETELLSELGRQKDSKCSWSSGMLALLSKRDMRWYSHVSATAENVIDPNIAIFKINTIFVIFRPIFIVHAII